MRTIEGHDVKIFTDNIECSAVLQIGQLMAIDVFGGSNAPLVIAEAERSGPVTNLAIPSFCVTEVTDQARFSNDGLASNPYAAWEGEFERELAEHGPQFQQVFGRNRIRHTVR